MLSVLSRLSLVKDHESNLMMLKKASLRSLQYLADVTFNLPLRLSLINCDVALLPQMASSTLEKRMEEMKFL